MSIDKLKVLNVAYSIANEFDYVPESYDEDGERVKKVYEIVDADENLIRIALNEWNGYSPYDIIQEIRATINGL